MLALATLPPDFRLLLLCPFVAKRLTWDPPKAHETLTESMGAREEAVMCRYLCIVIEISMW